MCLKFKYTELKMHGKIIQKISSTGASPGGSKVWGRHVISRTTKRL